VDTKTTLCAVLFTGSLISACASPAKEIPTQPATSPTTVPTRAPSNTPRPTSTPTATPTPTITLTPSITPTLSENFLTIGAGETIRIGYLLAESMELGIDGQRGIEVALDDAGRDLLGHPMELIGYDTECNSLAAGRQARRLLIEPNLLGVIGTSCSRAALGAAAVLAPAGVAMISPSNSDPDLTAVDSRPVTYFRTYPSDLVQARTVAEFAYSYLGATRMATLSYFSERHSQHLKEAACQASPEVLFAILSSPEAALVIQEFRDIPGLEEATLVVQELSFEPRLIELAGETAVGVYLSRTAWEFDNSSDAYQTFLLGYSDRFGGQPTTAFHAYAYDATALLLEAIRRAAISQPDGSLLVDREAILAQLYAVEGFAGLTGSLTCAPNGDCASDALGGLIYRIDSADPSTWNPGAGLSANPIQVWPQP